MKTVTLIATICCALEMLIQGYLLSMNYLRFRNGVPTINIVILVSNILFAASLSCFFLVLYKNQKS